MDEYRVYISTRRCVLKRDGKTRVSDDMWLMPDTETSWSYSGYSLVFAGDIDGVFGFLRELPASSQAALAFDIPEFPGDDWAPPFVFIVMDRMGVCWGIHGWKTVGETSQGKSRSTSVVRPSPRAIDWAHYASPYCRRKHLYNVLKNLDIQEEDKKELDGASPSCPVKLHTHKKRETVEDWARREIVCRREKPGWKRAAKNRRQWQRKRAYKGRPVRRGAAWMDACGILDGCEE